MWPIWQRARVTRAALVCIVAALGACHPAWGLLPKRSSGLQVAAVPTGDGAQYVSVTSEQEAPGSLRHHWRKAAGRACDGDYLVLSEAPSRRSTAGQPSGRTYEGFVRCVSPEATLADEDKPASEVKPARKPGPATPPPVL